MKRKAKKQKHHKNTKKQKHHEKAKKQKSAEDYKNYLSKNGFHLLTEFAHQNFATQAMDLLNDIEEFGIAKEVLISGNVFSKFKYVEYFKKHSEDIDISQEVTSEEVLAKIIALAHKHNIEEFFKIYILFLFFEGNNINADFTKAILAETSGDTICYLLRSNQYALFKGILKHHEVLKTCLEKISDIDKTNLICKAYEFEPNLHFYIYNSKDLTSLESRFDLLRLIYKFASKHIISNMIFINEMSYIYFLPLLNKENHLLLMNFCCQVKPEVNDKLMENLFRELNGVSVDYKTMDIFYRISEFNTPNIDDKTFSQGIWFLLGTNVKKIRILVNTFKDDDVKLEIIIKQIKSFSKLSFNFFDEMRSDTDFVLKVFRLINKLNKKFDLLIYYSLQLLNSKTANALSILEYNKSELLEILCANGLYNQAKNMIQKIQPERQNLYIKTNAATLIFHSIQYGYYNEIKRILNQIEEPLEIDKLLSNDNYKLITDAAQQVKIRNIAFSISIFFLLISKLRDATNQDKAINAVKANDFISQYFKAYLNNVDNIKRGIFIAKNEFNGHSNHDLTVFPTNISSFFGNTEIAVATKKDSLEINNFEILRKILYKNVSSKNHNLSKQLESLVTVLEALKSHSLCDTAISNLFQSHSKLLNSSKTQTILIYVEDDGRRSNICKQISARQDFYGQTFVSLFKGEHEQRIHAAALLVKFGFSGSFEEARNTFELSQKLASSCLRYILNSHTFALVNSYVGIPLKFALNKQKLNNTTYQI